jgi:DNA-directed RNA polymerase beta' subunit
VATKDKARQYTPTTVRRLDTLSRNNCYEPNCNKQLVGSDGKTIISKICHIKAASQNGPRYDALMNDDERRDFSNLLLLCDEHHRIIDNKENEQIYTVEVLTEWKHNHETLSLNKKIVTNSKLLYKAIEAIANLNFDDNIIDDKTKPFKIDIKIEYNRIKEYKCLIDEYKIYYGKIDALYLELEKDGAFKKIKLLQNIKNLYLKQRGIYISNDTSGDDELEVIRKNSDNIIKNIENILFESVELDDDSILAIPIIMVDAFMRCKILEEPINDSK